MSDEPVSSGESITVSCSVLKGDLPIEISWALNGETIRRSRSDINIVATSRKNSILTIESVAAIHAGEYTCSASNIAGATSQTATLAVNGKCLFRKTLIPYVLFIYFSPFRSLSNPFQSLSPTSKNLRGKTTSKSVIN